MTGGISRWVAKLPAWSARIAERVMALDDPTQVWSKRWVHLRSMIEDESTALLDELQWCCPKTKVEQLLFYKRLLMLLEGGHLSQATQLRRRAPALKLPAEITTLKGDVAARLARVESELLAEEFGDSSQTDHFEQTQAHWCMRMLSAWQRGSATPHPGAVASSDGVAATPEQEVELLRQHWAGIFQNVGDVNQAWWPPLLRRVPQVNWPMEMPSVNDVQSYLLNVSDKAPGPDEVSFGHLRPIAGIAAELILAFLTDLVAGVCPLASLFDTTFVFIPKSEQAAVPPGGWRPISLANCFVKAGLAVLFHPPMVKMHEWASPAHHGFCLGRVAEDSVAQVEYYALQGWRWSGASIFSADVRQAFPTVHRSWCRAVLRASGAPEWLCCILEFWLQPSYAFIRWRGTLYAGFLVSSGLLQGLPSSPLWFVLCLDSWLRFANSLLQPSGIMQAYVDDTLVVLLKASAVRLVPALYLMLWQATGLQLAKHKCKLMPLAHAPSVSQDYVSSFWKDVEVVDSFEYLGFTLSRGVHMEIAAKALRKMEHRLPLILDMQLGTAGAIQIARACVYSCLTHILRVAEPSDAMIKIWQRIESKTAWGLRAVLGEMILHLKPLFRLPVKLPMLKLVSLQMRAAAIRRQHWSPVLVWQEMEAQMEEGPLMHPCYGWSKHSIWNTWSRTCLELRELGLSSTTLTLQPNYSRKLAKLFLPAPTLIRAQFVGLVTVKARAL